MMEFELSKPVIISYLTGSLIASASLATQCSTELGAFLELVKDEANWSVTPKTGVYSIQVNGKKLSVKPSTNERELAFSIK